LEVDLKMGHVTLTMPLLGMVCHSRLGISVYLHAKFDNTRFSRSRDIIGVAKYKVIQNSENAVVWGVVKGHSRSLVIAPFDRTHTRRDPINVP